MIFLSDPLKLLKSSNNYREIAVQYTDLFHGVHKVFEKTSDPSLLGLARKKLNNLDNSL